MTDSSPSKAADTAARAIEEDGGDANSRLRTSLAEAMTRAVLQKARADALFGRIQVLEETIELLRAKARGGNP